MTQTIICQHDNGLEELNDYEGGCADCGAIVAIVQDHAHTYRADISDWYCTDCDTVTDYCQQLNPF